ncbi:MAG TPA: MTH938/NDUFAF3 family protein [Chitinophagales bacterium]|nr:MTH938/NDUFAF3 family protein [Chitinophagales bacterium]
MIKIGEHFKIEDELGTNTIEFNWIPPGSFIMGSPNDEIGRANDEEQIKVIITEGFWLSRYVVTISQWNRFLCNSIGNTKIDLPKTNISWNDAISFCEKLNETFGSLLPTGYEFSLPSEAQWEYSARAGTSGVNYIGNDFSKLKEIAWIAENSNKTLQEVGTLLKNGFGLYDMLGNVFQWCYDYYEPYKINGVEFNNDRIILLPLTHLGEKYQLRTARGCSFMKSMSSKADGRIATRIYPEAHTSSDFIGFRIALRPIKNMKNLLANGIRSAEWSAIEFSDSTFKDVLATWNGHLYWDWSVTDTHHSPGIQISDISQILELARLDLLILSTGYNNKLQISENTIDFLKNENIEYIILNTKEAVRLYNLELLKGTKVGAIIHSTC